MKISIYIVVIIVSCFIISSNSCTLDPVGSINSDTTESFLSKATSNLIYQEDFEGREPFSTASGLEVSNENYALSYVTSPVFQGRKAARFEIRKGQPLVGRSKRIRSEVNIIKSSDPRFTKDMWYSFAVLFPSRGFEFDNTREAINQWFEDGSDETTIRCEKDKVFLEVTPPERSSTLTKYDLFRPQINSPRGSTTGSVAPFVPMTKNTWHEFVFHFIHSFGKDGLVEIWRDGVKIHRIEGRNMHMKYPKWKLGLYKTSFLKGSSKRHSRVIYFDNIRVGNSNASFKTMTSGVEPK